MSCHRLKSTRRVRRGIDVVLADRMESRGGGGGSERAKANDQINDDTKDSPDKIFDTGRLRNAAGASKVRRKTRSKMKDGSSQDTAGANGRPKRTPKPSRRAAEAASAK